MGRITFTWNRCPNRREAVVPKHQPGPNSLAPPSLRWNTSDVISRILEPSTHSM